MRKLFVAIMATALWFIAYPLASVQLHGPPAISATVSPPCGTPAATAQPGNIIRANEWNNEVYHLESCAASAVPSPQNTSSPTAGTNVTVTGTYPYIISAAALSGITSVIAGTNISVSGSTNVTVSETVTPGPQATPSPTASTCIGIGSTWPYTVGVDLTCTGVTYTGANTYSGLTTYSNTIEAQGAGAQSCGNGAAIAAATGEICASGTSAAGIVLGPTNGAWSAGTPTTAPSQSILLCRVVSSVYTCPGSILMTAGGILQLNTNSSISTSNAAMSVGTGNLTHGKEIMGAQCTLSAAGTMASGSTACKLTFTGIATMAVTYPSAYTNQAICIAQDETTTNGAKVTACSTSAATVTATSGDVVDFMVIGN